MERAAVRQVARVGVAGPGFLEFLARFEGEMLGALHSGHGQGFSVIGRRPLVSVTARAGRFEVKGAPGFLYDRLETVVGGEAGGSLERWERVLESVTVDDPHHLLSGWIGYVSYDIARELEEIGSMAADDLHWPALLWQLFSEYYLYDHAAGTWSLVATVGEGEEREGEATLERMAAQVAALFDPAKPFAQGALIESVARGTYLKKVERIKEYIAAGDIFQANFAQRWVCRTEASPIQVFRQLMRESPAAYAALIIEIAENGERRACVSASPELFLYRSGNHLLTRPIKGTRPRDLREVQRDEALREELLRSEKDKAELAMIVDLLRNDLGKVAQYGSVQVSSAREIEKLPTLWHAVATIEAELLPARDVSVETAGDPRRVSMGQGWAPLLRALMPGGSITGAPKIRAMQIIEELEPTRRGIYCGVIGCINAARNPGGETIPAGMLNIAIRTIQMVGDRAYVHAGGGIVADSDPAMEYEESLHKAAAMLRALGVESPPEAGISAITASL